MRNFLIKALISFFLIMAAVSQQPADAAPGDFLFNIGVPNVFQFPSGIAVDGAGNVYVTDQDRVQVFDKTGKFLRTWGSYGSGNGEFAYPTGLAVSGNQVYVADTGNNRIQVFDSNGNFIRTWGSLGSTNGLLDYPQAIALDGKGYAYVADTNNSRIQVFDSSGNFVRTVGTPGNNAGELSFPQDVALDAAGNIFVVDIYRINVFDNTGKFLRTWDPYGYDNHLAIDSGTGTLYVSSVTENGAENDLVKAYDLSGNLLREWGSFGVNDGQFNGMGQLAVDGSHNVYVVDTSNNRVQIFDSGGKFLRKIGDQDGTLHWPLGTATDRFGNVYVTDRINYRVDVFDAAGRFLRKFGSFGTGDGQFAYQDGPYGVAVDGAGNVYVGNNGSDPAARIQVFDSSGNFLRKWQISSENPPYIAGLALDSGNNVYVVDYATSRIVVFNSSGTELRSWGSYGSGNGQFNFPQGIAVDASGNVYVVDSGNQRIQVFNSNGTFLRTWGSFGTGDGQFTQPQWIAIDGAGHVYVTDYDYNDDGNRVEVFDTSGKFLGKWGSTGTGPGQFRNPGGIAATPSGGTVYVADTDINGQVQAYAGYGEPLPAGWLGRDIGSVGIAGTSSYLNGSFTVKGSGANIWGTADAFHYVYRPLTGDGQIIARVTAVQNTNGYAKGGVMIRESLTAGSRHAMVDLTPSYGAEFSRRLSAGGSTTVTASAGVAAPEWVKLVRQGSTFSGYISKDGTNWTSLGSASISMAGTVYVGLVANSHNNSVLCTTTMDRVSLSGQTNTPTVTMTSPAQGATFTAPAAVTVTASATPSTGAVVKKVEFYAGSTLIGTELNGPYSLAWNNVAAGSYSLSARVTDSFGGTATSDAVTITVNASALPSPWLTQDVGSVGVAGSAGYANGTFTVKGSGSDIYGSADAFRFVYQPMSGNGQIVAKVLSVQNTNSYAKAGIMIRQSLAANSMHAMMDLRPTGGAEFSRRTSTGGSTSVTTRSGIAAPYWVRLVRSGSTFTGFVSSDGVNWSQVGSASIGMTSSVYVGLIVNSHSNGVLCTGTMNGVAVSGVDPTPPTVTAFTIPATSSSLTVPITSFTATDNVGVTGYLVTESSGKPSASASGWSATPQTQYSFTSTGAKTLYAWAKDAAGNVSNSKSATVTISGGALPTPWLTQDIGSVGVIGSASYANGLFTLKGSGADIWGTADAFRSVYKVMTGDGQIIARVASVQNTNSYAKGGVMMRQSLAANSMHAMMDLRPTGGAEFSRRTATGGTTSATTRTGIAPPYWVKLVRSGNTFTGSVSSDGVTWSQVGSVSIGMSSSIYVGLIDNSHSNSVLCTATFDNVK